ncbi:MAG: hypothetical protein DELT_02762 [Desulfovibrio sp.]
MPCFINLPSRWVHQQPAWVTWFTGGKIAPEFGFDDVSLNLPDSWHKEMAKRFRDEGIACGVHLPFLGIDPSDPNPQHVKDARRALRRGAELARIYGARHMIGHPYFRPKGAGRENRQSDDVNGGWMERSLAAWPEIAAIGGAPLHLENTYEKSPEAIAALVGLLQKEKQPEDVIGVCFDLGHWHAFAGCAAPEEFDPWLDAYAPFAMHLHLHDNTGKGDYHMALGAGSVPFDAFFERLAARGKNVTATLEPHDVQAFTGSIAWLLAHDAIAERLDWRKPLMEALPLAEIEKNLAM